VQRTGAAWSVTASFFEIGRTVQYRCTYDPAPAMIEIVEEEAIPGFGLPDVGHVRSGGRGIGWIAAGVIGRTEAGRTRASPRSGP
jgi:hypothetical protein